MEIWQLKTFSVAAKTLHFTRAAEELNLSQPAVSHQIKSLESEIGEPLFLRDKEGVWLTRAGQTMYEHVSKILDIADEMRLEIRENKDILSGKIILGASTKGLGSPFAFFYENFKKTYPDIELVAQTETTLEDIVEKVKDGKIDIGVISKHPDLNSLVVLPFAEYEMILVVGKIHRLAQKQVVTADDLRDEQWLVYEPRNRMRMMSDDFLAKAGITAKNIYETNDGTLIRTMLTFGNAVSILPFWGILEEVKEGKIVPIKIKGLKPYKIQINLIWKNSRRTKAMSAVLNYLIQGKIEGLRVFESKEKN
jgi:DNA-binding transcriptional LysR family regulator